MGGAAGGFCHGSASAGVPGGSEGRRAAIQGRFLGLPTHPAATVIAGLQHVRVGPEAGLVPLVEFVRFGRVSGHGP
jgi:hypothetical protein